MFRNNKNMVWNGMNISGIDMDATSKKISRLIDESGYSDKELGRIMGLSVQSINKWRHGRNLPDIENLFILSRILGTKVDDFLVPLESKPQFVVEFQSDIVDFTDPYLRRMWVYLLRVRGRISIYPQINGIA